MASIRQGRLFAYIFFHKLNPGVDDRRGEGNALGNLGVAYGQLGGTSKAIDYHEQALAISHEIGDQWKAGNER